MKKITLLNAVFVFTVQQRASAQFSPSCLTQTIDISTGVDHVAATLYPLSASAATPVLDKYWQITGIPTNTTGLTAPNCAQLFLSSLSSSFWPSSPDCSYLGVVADPEPANVTQIAPTGNFFWNCPPAIPYAPTATPTIFSRSFYVQSATKEDITINIPNFWGDDYGRIYLDKTTPVYTIASTSTTSGVTITSVTINVSPGVHTIDVQLWDISGKATGIKLSGSITAKNNVLINNNCFGKTNSDCIIDKAPQLRIKNLSEVNSTMSLIPNPACSNTTLRMELPYGNEVKVSIMDFTGKNIAEIFNGHLSKGVQNVNINTGSLSSGIYLVKLSVGDEVIVQRLSVLN